MLNTTKSFIWLSSVILLCIVALGLIVGQSRLQDAVITELVPHIVSNQNGVIVQTTSGEEHDSYTGGQILYSLRAWLNDGITIMVDDQVISVKSEDNLLDFPPALSNAKQIDLNGIYVATFTYHEGDVQAIQSINFTRK